MQLRDHSDLFLSQTEANGQHIVNLSVMPAIEYASWLAKQTEGRQAWLNATGFTGKSGQTALCLNAQCELGCAVFIIPAQELQGAKDWSALVAALPAGIYRLDTDLSSQRKHWLGLGWVLGQYSYDCYKKRPETGSKHLIWPENVDIDQILSQAVATTFVRDLVNTPADDMAPFDLAEAARGVAKVFDADFHELVGEELLHENFPAVYAVGRASDQQSHLIDLRWGIESHPKVTIVGKGVCFDTGGLDLKPASGMKIMKKDMGGAANALGLAYMIMAANLPVRLRVLIPAVENSVAGNALHPMDIVTTRSGQTVEIGNTDAEGRVILSDAITAAGEENPELILDFATLTGAARVALGPDMPAMYTGSDQLAEELAKHSQLAGDPLWRMPLWQPYAKMIESKLADINNSGDSPFAGSITAALFLSSFVPDPNRWMHFDLYAWNPVARPGQPDGGEAQTIHAVFGMLSARYGQNDAEKP